MTDGITSNLLLQLLRIQCRSLGNLLFIFIILFDIDWKRRRIEEVFCRHSGCGSFLHVLQIHARGNLLWTTAAVAWQWRRKPQFCVSCAGWMAIEPMTPIKFAKYRCCAVVNLPFAQPARRTRGRMCFRIENRRLPWIALYRLFFVGRFCL